VMQALLDRGVASRRGIMCAHREPAYVNARPRFPLTESERAQDCSLILPLYHSISETEQQQVATALRDACTPRLG